MSIFSEVLDPISSFITDNKSWLKPVISTGLGALQQSNTDNTQSQYLDYLKQREDQNYQDSVNQINTYNASLGSGGSGGNGAGAAAARQTEANRQVAAKKANTSQQNTYKDLLKLFAPYRQAADTLLPQMTQTYQDSLGLQKSLQGYLARPDQVAKLDAAGPAWNVNVPLPDSVRIK